MKNKFYLIILACWFFMACGSENTTQEQNGQVVEQLVAEDFEKKLSSSSDVQLIDVRTPEEFNEKFIKNAINIDFNDPDYFASEIAKLDKTKPTFVYCYSGGRSADAVEMMSAQGFQELYELKGGISKWLSASKPVEISTVANNSQDEMTDEDLQKRLGTDKLVLIDFSAVWCAPCKKLSPILDKLGEEMNAEVEVIKIDVDKNPAIAQKYKVEGLPTLLLFKNSNVVWQQQGFIDEPELKEVLLANK
jgi:thioredoxin